MLNKRVKVEFLVSEFLVLAISRGINFAMQDGFSIKSFKNNIITL